MNLGLVCRRGANGLKAALWLLGCGLAAQAFAAPAGAGAEVFKLSEVSVFSPGGSQFLHGQAAICQDTPFGVVKAYPSFVSKKPIYGLVTFALPVGKPDPATQYYFVLDESGGTGRGYDRLYFDLNHDLDLSKEPIVRPWPAHPRNAEEHEGNIKQQVIFDCITVNFECGPAGIRPIQLLPRLIRSSLENQIYNDVGFVRTRLYGGQITVGGTEFHALLGNDNPITGRLDSPSAALLLTAKGRNDPVASWWGGDRLRAIHRVDGKLFTFAASPTGEELTVRPYRGELGTFEIGPGGRKLDKLTVSGSLGATNIAIAIGGEEAEGEAKEVHRCQVPVGDYLPEYLTIQFGRLQVEVSDNYHSEGEPRSHPQGRVYAMAVRKDQPFVLDFSNRPEVLFASPPKGHRLKLGDTLEVFAVLVDPKLDIMVRGLYDTTRTQTKDAEGKPLGAARYFSLDPKVVITRANGEQVSEGVMPFG